MACISEPTARERKGWRKWVASRPAHVRAVAERFQPWELYRMKSTGQRVIVMSFGEKSDGTVSLTVRISGQFNQVAFERDVFGVDPDDLEPCELPGPDEPVGTALTPAEAEENIDELRLLVRPDLWTRHPVTGKAVRKQ